MHFKKKIGFSLFTLFIVMQFFQPVYNQSTQVLSTDITKTYNIPDSVLSILKIACYDCHSNNTHYPGYAYLQPIGWFLDYHIRNGKDKLNFSDFGSYSKRRQTSKLKSIADQLKDDKMPLSTYTFMHKNAILTNESKEIIINWAYRAKEAISKN